jgi:hypothetical protein
MAPSLGVLVADAGRLGVAVELVRCIPRSPVEASLFLMDDAVEVAHDPRLRALLDDGAEVALCAGDAEARGVRPLDGGPRFGSQYDHAVMMRDAARVISLCGVRIDDCSPTKTSGRRVAVRLTREAHHPKTAQGLRAAVGYAACDLGVTVLVEPVCRSLLVSTEMPLPLLKALATLRGLGHTLVGVAPHRLAPSSVSADIEVTW